MVDCGPGQAIEKLGECARTRRIAAEHTVANSNGKRTGGRKLLSRRSEVRCDRWGSFLMR
jgi:hypothetical protein